MVALLAGARPSKCVQKMRRYIHSSATCIVFVDYRHDSSADLDGGNPVSMLGSFVETVLHGGPGIQQEREPSEGEPCTSSRARRYQTRSRPNTPVNAFEEYLNDLQRAEELALSTYSARIEELRSDAEDEGIVISPDSERDFWDFVTSRTLNESGDLFVTDEGHIRFVWRGDDSDHLGIRFFGDRIVRYVIFRRRPGERNVSRVAGDDNFDGVVRQAHLFDLPVFVA